MAGGGGGEGDAVGQLGLLAVGEGAANRFLRHGDLSRLRSRDRNRDVKGKRRYMDMI